MAVEWQHKPVVKKYKDTNQCIGVAIMRRWQDALGIGNRSMSWMLLERGMGEIDQGWIKKGKLLKC